MVLLHRPKTNLVIDEGSLGDILGQGFWTWLAWMVLIPAAAEGITTELLPGATRISGLDMTATLPNLLGALLEGIRFAVDVKAVSPVVRQLCRVFKLFFLSALTSFPFVAIHAAEVWIVSGALACATYLCTTLILTALAFELGRLVATTFGDLNDSASPGHWTRRVESPDTRRNLLAGAAAVVAVALTKSLFPPIFGAVENGPRLLSTAIGMLLSFAGAQFGLSLGKAFTQNVASCVIVAAIFFLQRWLDASTAAASSVWLIVMTNFVGAFCGTASGFAAAITEVAQKTFNNGQPGAAVVTLLYNLGLAGAFTIGLFTFDRRGLDVCAHSLRAYCT